MKKTILLFILFFCYHLNAVCCSCYGKGRVTVEDFNSYKAIFVGKLIRQWEVDTDDYKSRRMCVYKVLKNYKGSDVDTIIVSDAEDSGACGLGRMFDGRHYLIFAYGDDKLFTSSCMRTTLVPMLSWPKDSARIKSLESMKSFGRLYDTARTNFYADTPFLNKHITKVHDNTFQIFLDESGKVSAEGRYKNGRESGYWKYYDGGQITEGKYVDGKKDSIWTEPYSKEMTYLREYKLGKFTYRETVFWEGRMTSKTEPVGDGRKWVMYDFHPNGLTRYIAYASPPEMSKDGQLERPAYNGAFKMFNKKGILLQAGNCRQGLDIGHWKYYYNDGKLRMEGDYAEGKKNGTWKIYYPNKRVKATGAYKDDEKTGTWNYYDATGKKIPADAELIKEDEDWSTYSG